MPIIKINVTRPTALGPRPATGSMLWEPTRRRQDSTTIKLPLPFYVHLIGGNATVTVDATTPEWVWKVTELFDHTDPVTHYYSVHGSTTYPQLTKIDPATLDLTQEPEKLWWDAFRNLQLPSFTLPEWLTRDALRSLVENNNAGIETRIKAYFKTLPPGPASTTPGPAGAPGPAGPASTVPGPAGASGFTPIIAKATTHTSTGASSPKLIPTGSASTIPFTSAIQDAASWNAANPTRLTATATGVYNLSAFVSWYSNATGQRAVGYKVNGGTNTYRDSKAAAVGGLGTQHNFIELGMTLTAGDYIEIIGLQSSGADVNVDAGATLVRIK